MYRLVCHLAVFGSQAMEGAEMNGRRNFNTVPMRSGALARFLWTLEPNALGVNLPNSAYAPQPNRLVKPTPTRTGLVPSTRFAPCGAAYRGR